MKKILFVLLIFLSFNAKAQQYKFIQDGEQLFTTDEMLRLDSLLQQTFRQTGKIILIVTDSTDVNSPDYKNDFFVYHFSGQNIDKAGMMFLLSRKSQTVKLITSKRMEVYQISQEKLINLLEPGLISLKEQRREEAAMIICKNIIAFFDELKEK